MWQNIDTVYTVCTVCSVYKSKTKKSNRKIVGFIGWAKIFVYSYSTFKYISKPGKAFFPSTQQINCVYYLKEHKYKKIKTQTHTHTYIDDEISLASIYMENSNTNNTPKIFWWKSFPLFQSFSPMTTVIRHTVVIAYGIFSFHSLLNEILYI